MAGRIGRPLAAGLFCLLVTVSAGAAPPGVYFPETFTLDNGLQVVVVTNRRVPVVTQMVWYKVGAADQHEGQSGIAHFLEHLMFKGTDTVAPGEFSKIVARHGGRDNAFTSWDYTAYFQTVASDRLEMVMRLEADRMVNLRLTDAVVYPERDVVLEEWRQRTGNRPADRLREQVTAALFVHHPYRAPILGWEPEIRIMSRPVAEAFYQTWYAPNNAVLVISGDADVAQVRPLAEKYFGPIAARPVPARQRVTEPRQTAERRVILRDAEVRQPAFERFYQAPSYHRGDRGDAYPLQVLSEIMGDGATSRLHRALVVERKLASSAWFYYSPDAFDLGSLGFGGSPVPGGDMAALEAGFEAEIARLLKDGVTDDEVASARERMLNANAYARDSLQGPAQVLGRALAIGGTVEEVEAWPERIDQVTAEQVTAAARRVLSRPDSVTGLLLPAAAGAQGS